jgi:hypothetical protein
MAYYLADGTQYSEGSAAPLTVPLVATSSKKPVAFFDRQSRHIVALSTEYGAMALATARFLDCR